MLKKILSTVAPFLGAMIGGPFGAIATKAVGTLLLDDEAAKPQQVEQAISEASPEQLLALKQLDINYQDKMAELGLDEQRLKAFDREDARKRQIKLKDRMPSILALLLTSGFFGVLLVMMFHAIPSSVQNVIDVMLGALGTAWIACITYYFGSSHHDVVKSPMVNP